MLGRDRDVSPERTPLLSGRRIVGPVLPGPPPPLPGPPGPAAPRLLPLLGVGILKDAGETPEDFILPGLSRLAAQATATGSLLRYAGPDDQLLPQHATRRQLFLRQQVAQHAGEPPGSPAARRQGWQNAERSCAALPRPLQLAAWAKEQPPRPSDPEKGAQNDWKVALLRVSRAAQIHDFRSRNSPIK